ncbi:MAG: AAA family ATPase [Anaerolineae bacterium]
MNRNIADLIALMRRRYPDWDGFRHPGFAADEITYKQETIKKAAQWINQVELDQLIETGDFETCIHRLTKLSQDNNLLWRRAPSRGDTAVLHHPALNEPDFCTQIRNLLYGDRPSPDRLQSFADYCAAHDLPNKWPLPTYLLFITHPQTELFVKPRAAEWFLKFMGEPQSVQAPPTAVLYRTILHKASQLFDQLRAYGARDMVDVQSFIWVCFRESKGRIGRLNAKGQVELDVPATKPLPSTRYTVRETAVLLRERDDETISEQPVYPLAEWAQDSGYDETVLQQWVDAVERKGQAIFYGPPGAGKTFMAEKMARHLSGGDDGFVELVQFHPAYAYEDFMQGIRPFTEDGMVYYEMVPGRFIQFCKRAGQRNGRCTLIIDEINRANLASVFGELMYLLEYRARTIPLAGGDSFSIPENVRILGTMNTADRSIALVDHALRRRFAFIHLAANYDVLRHYHQSTDFDPTRLIAVLNQLNAQIGDPHYHIGPAYFLHPQIDHHLEAIWRLEIEPYLEEYFFGQQDKMANFRWPKIAPQLTGGGTT